MPWPKKVLLVKPVGFRVEYAINPYMLDENGNLQQVDSGRAGEQWKKVTETFARLGLSVATFDGLEQFPDMVFCANQTLPILDAAGTQHFVLSRMKSNQRKGEVPYFKRWAEENGYQTFPMTDFDFEGGGDAIWNYETGELFGGYGFRSDVRAYDVLEKEFGVRVHRLELVREEFYHMDTCLAVIDAGVVAVVASAFASESLRLIRSKFKTVIEIDPDEARQHFAGNCVSVDGKHVMLQKGAAKLAADLRRLGFEPVEADVSEFIKAGGGPFCIKQLFA